MNRRQLIRSVAAIGAALTVTPAVKAEAAPVGDAGGMMPAACRALGCRLDIEEKYGLLMVNHNPRLGSWTAELAIESSYPRHQWQAALDEWSAQTHQARVLPTLMPGEYWVTNTYAAEQRAEGYERGRSVESARAESRFAQAFADEVNASGGFAATPPATMAEYERWLVTRDALRRSLHAEAGG